MAELNTEFNHAANDSPRSGGSKHAAPVVWCVVVVVMAAIGTWLAMTV